MITDIQYLLNKMLNKYFLFLTSWSVLQLILVTLTYWAVSVVIFLHILKTGHEVGVSEWS